MYERCFGKKKKQDADSDTEYRPAPSRPRRDDYYDDPRNATPSRYDTRDRYDTPTPRRDEYGTPRPRRDEYGGVYDTPRHWRDDYDDARYERTPRTQTPPSPARDERTRTPLRAESPPPRWTPLKADTPRTRTPRDESPSRYDIQTQRAPTTPLRPETPLRTETPRTRTPAAPVRAESPMRYASPPPRTPVRHGSPSRGETPRTRTPHSARREASPLRYDAVSPRALPTPLGAESPTRYASPPPRTPVRHGSPSRGETPRTRTPHSALREASPLRYDAVSPRTPHTPLRAETPRAYTPSTPSRPITPFIPPEEKQEWGFALKEKRDKEKALTADEIVQFQEQCLREHNKYREHHGVQPLVLKKPLCRIAQEWAGHLAEIETLDNHKHFSYGENLFRGKGTIFTAEDVIKNWYNEGESYDFSKPAFHDSNSHFTQIIWKDTKYLGVGIQIANNHTYIVCNYHPAGNVIGNFGAQVLPIKAVPQLTDKTITDAKAQVYRDEFANACLEVHNKYRIKHGCPPLILSAQLNKHATEWAQHLAKIGTLEHRPNDKYGQNLFMATNYDPSAEEVIKDWYEEIDQFDFNNPTFTPDTGNFTQLMWKGTKELGVGIEKVGATTILICSYHPHGNVMGRFKENVPPLKTKLEYGIKTPSETSIEEEVLAKEEKPAEPPAAIPADSFEDECLKSHNKYRDMHGCPPLVLNKELNTYATEWAEHLARTDKFEHRTNNRYGENLYYMSGSFTPTPEDAVKAWYDEISMYNYKKPGFHSSTGHFTQVVWKKTKQLGVGRATKDRTTVVVCNYEPHGNVIDHFAENVPQVGGTILKEEQPIKKPEDIAREASQFEEQCLKVHNKYRALHGVPPLKLNKKLTAYAAEWATVQLRIFSLTPRKSRDYFGTIRLVFACPCLCPCPRDNMLNFKKD
ncbi:hypothetical protein GQX74_001645 [Glossina fuscipes]|nr:hypothetical protein GQX74_001645 [Glossina fuscipes]